MGKIIFFILGTLGGVALAAVLYLQASAKYDAVLKGNKNLVALEEAQTLWPPYLIDARFQNDLKRLKDKGVSGPNVTIYLKDNVSVEDVESLVNQLEVMDGVTEVQWNTLEKPLEYISNMSTLPGSKEEIRDNIVVVGSGAGTAEEVTEFAKLQEVVDTVSPSQ